MKLPVVLTVPHPLLRQSLEPVATFDAALADLASVMIEVMRQEEGVGLAANQIGVNTRLFVYGIDEPFELHGRQVAAVPDQAVINPVVEVLDPTLDTFEEGCLSIPGLRGPVARPIQIKLTGFTLTGQPIDRIVSGYEARVIQHEVDHLNGKLFLDYITDPSKLYRVNED